MAGVGLVEEVDDFLAAYIAAFSPGGSAAAIAALYHAPCLLVRGNGEIRALSTEAEIAGFLGPVAEGLWNEGTVAWACGDRRVTATGGRSCMVSVTWSPLRADGSAIRSWGQSYNLVRTAHGPRILLSTFHIAAQ